MEKSYEDMTAEELADAWNEIDSQFCVSLTKKQSDMYGRMQEIDEEMNERDEFRDC